MSKMKYSAEQLCHMYPEKYIAINHICKDEHNVIVGAEVLKVYDTFEDCKNHADEIKFYMKLNKNDFDIIYGDYVDYVETRSNSGVIELPFYESSYVDEDGTIVIDALKTFGFMGLAMFGYGQTDNVVETKERGVE